MSVLYSRQNQLHSKSQQISWKNKVQTAWRKDNCLQVTQLIFSQLASPSQLGEVLVNPVALSVLGVQPMLTILKTRRVFIPAESGSTTEGKSFVGREKLFSIREKCFSFCSEKKQNLQIFIVPRQFSPMKISIF